MQGVQELAFGNFTQFNGWEGSLKNIEHCLCEYQKYKKGSVKPYKSRAKLDPQDPCAKCGGVATAGEPMVRCDLCALGYYVKCLPKAIQARAEAASEFVCRDCSRRLAGAGK